MVEVEVAAVVVKKGKSCKDNLKSEHWKKSVGMKGLVEV